MNINEKKNRAKRLKMIVWEKIAQIAKIDFRLPKTANSVDLINDESSITSIARGENLVKVKAERCLAILSSQ